MTADYAETRVTFRLGKSCLTKLSSDVSDGNINRCTWYTTASNYQPKPN